MQYDSHHAYFFSGSYEESLKKVRDYLSSKNFALRGNPDFLEKETSSFSIEDARDLRDWALLKPLGQEKIALVKFVSITSEAQNALLKLLEEPGLSIKFFFFSDSESSLLPTLRSRLFIERGDEEFSKKRGEEFLRLDINKRLKEIEKISKSDNKKQEILDLFRSIEVFVSNFKDKSFLKEMNELLNIKKYILHRSPSIKMIGEYISLRLPKL